MNMIDLEKKSANFSSYDDLKAWLLNEIGEVPISTLQKYHLPAILGNLSTLTEKEANDVLKKVFIEAFMSENDYKHQVDFLSQVTPRETRLKINSPLPSTDFSFLLKSLPGVDYLQRAAALSHAAGSLHLQFMTGDLSTSLSRGNKSNTTIYNNVFGTGIVPGATEHQIQIAKDSTHINVLFRGHAHLVHILENGALISPEQIYCEFEKITSDDILPGITGLLRSIPLDLAYKLSLELEGKILHKLNSALFTVCLDELPSNESSPGSLNDRFTAFFSRNRANRWYGMTQILVRTDAEAAIMFSYMGGMEGVQAHEVAKELYDKSCKINWPEKGKVSSLTPKHRLNLEITEPIAVQLHLNSQDLFHDHPSVFTLPLGLDFLKGIRISPNITMNFLFMLAFKDAGDLSYLPETSQAIIVREGFWGGVQLDWLRTRPEDLRCFLENPTDLSLFRKAVENHKALIAKSRALLSPFLFFDNRMEEKDPDLLAFYLALGQEESVGAYRHYLCPVSRNPKALDIITSSVKLQEGVELIGRPGTRSRLVGISGSHIIFDDKETHIVFTPTQPWEDKLPDVVDRMHYWMNHLNALDKKERESMNSSMNLSIKKHVIVSYGSEKS